jgi:hypothetical protein
VLVAGGGDTNNTSELYDPIADKWSAPGTLVMGRGQHTATLLPNGKVLVVAGFDKAHYLNSAELYDRATNTWSAAGTLAAERQSPTATLLSVGKVLVAGAENSGILNSAELDDFDHKLLHSLEKFIGYLRLVWLPELAKQIETKAGCGPQNRRAPFCDCTIKLRQQLLQLFGFASAYRQRRCIQEHH